MVARRPEPLTPDSVRRVFGPATPPALGNYAAPAGVAGLPSCFTAASAGPRWHLYAGEPVQHAGSAATDPSQYWPPGHVERCRERALRMEQRLDEQAFAGRPDPDDQVLTWADHLHACGIALPLDTERDVAPPRVVWQAGGAQ